MVISLILFDAARAQFGLRGVVDLTTFQLLDHYFSRVREVEVA